MTEQNNNTQENDFIKLILNAGPYQRCDERTGYANGFKPRNLNTTMGELDLLMPQVRDCETPFETSLMENGSRSERSLKVAIAQMYIQGVSTRRVAKVMETMCSLSVTSSQVLNLTSKLDGEF